MSTQAPKFSRGLWAVIYGVSKQGHLVPQVSERLVSG